MRKWKTLAAPDDETVWADVSNMWPTQRGTYEVADIYPTSNTAITATGESGSPLGAWAFSTLSSTRAYYIGKKFWQLDAALATATDRSGALAEMTDGGHACQYGDITIVTRGVGASLVSSSGGDFAAIAGAPSARYVCAQSNCVLAFATSTSLDGWSASDVGDYTNWSTGEAASGRILENNGAITAVVPYGDDVIVFKRDSIFRMTYVGGAVKWQIQKIVNGIGCYPANFGGSPAVVTSRGIFFCGGFSRSSNRFKYYLFDGASFPRCINEETELAWGAGIPIYDPNLDIVSLYINYTGGTNDYRTYVYYYGVDVDAWGVGPFVDLSSTQIYSVPLRGDQNAAAAYTGAVGPARPIFIGTVIAADQFQKRAAGNPGSVASLAYVQTSKIGRPDLKTTFKRLTPLLRRRSDYSSGTPSVALSCSYFVERHDTSAASTRSVTESTQRDRFDFLDTNNYGQFKVTFTDMDAEVDDFMVSMNAAGTD